MARKRRYDHLLARWAAERNQKAEQAMAQSIKEEVELFRRIKQEAAEGNAEAAVRLRLMNSRKFRASDGSLDIQKIDWFIGKLRKEGKIPDPPANDQANNPASLIMSPRQLARINKAKYGRDKALSLARKQLNQSADNYDLDFFRDLVEELGGKVRRNPTINENQAFADSFAEDVLESAQEWLQDKKYKAHYRGKIETLTFIILENARTHSTSIERWILLDGDKVAGAGIISQYNDQFSTLGAYLAKGYRRKGLYPQILRRLKKVLGTLVSDLTMTPGAVRAWEKAGGTWDGDPRVWSTRMRMNPGVLRPRPGFWKELGVKREGLKKVQADLWKQKGIWKTIDELEQFVLANQTKLLQGMIRVVK